MHIACSALTETVLESELFGKRGVFESAEGGTVFLDEISGIAPSLQPKLLRVLEEKTGVGVRVISATNTNLEEAARAGRFRGSVLSSQRPATRAAAAQAAP
jgi:transcriptional regulator with GAF, ATPase, and Fis domain